MNIRKRPITKKLTLRQKLYLKLNIMKDNFSYFHRIEKFVFLFMVLIYIYVVYNQINTEIYNENFRSVKNFILKSDEDKRYEFLHSKEDLKLFINDFIDNISKNFSIQNQLYVKSNIRATVRRMKLVNYSDEFFKKERLVWASNTFSEWSSYDESLENRTTWSLSNGKTLEYSFNNSFFQLGGYVMNFNLTNFFISKQNISIDDSNAFNLDEIKNSIKNTFSNLIDEYTTHKIIIDFQLFNYDLSRVCPVIIIITLTNSAEIFSTLDVFFLDKDIYTGGEKIFRLVLEVIFVICFLVDIFFFIIQIRNSVNLKVYKSLEEIKIKQENKNNKLKTGNLIKSRNHNEEDEEISKSNVDKTQRSNVKMIDNFFEENENQQEVSEKIKINTNLILLYLEEIFFNLGNFFRILSIVIVIVCIDFWCHYAIYLLTNTKIIENIFLGETTDVVNLNLQEIVLKASIAFRNYTQLVAITFFLMTLRTARYILESLTSFKLFLTTLYYALEDLISFFIMFMTFYFALCFFSFLYFSKFYDRFRDFSIVLQLNFNFLIGNIDSEIAYNLYKISPFITVLYLVSIILIMKSIILKILLAIMLYNFKIAFDESSAENRENKMMYTTFEELEKDDEKIHWLFRAVKLYKKIVDFICNKISCKCKSISLIVKTNESEGFKFMSQEVPRDFLDYNKKYSKNYLLEKSQEFFESELDSEKLSSYYEYKNRSSFIYLIAYVIVLAIFIYNSVLNVLSPWQLNHKTAILDAFNDYINFKFTSNKDLIKYFTNDFYKKFHQTVNKNFTLQDINVLLYNEAILTIRRSGFDRENGYIFSDDVRIYTNINLDGEILYENKTNFSTKKYLYEYSTLYSYRNLGGYTKQLKFEKDKRITYDELVSVLDFYTIGTYVEFFLRNLESNMIIYVVLTCEFDYGGNHLTKVNTQLISPLLELNSYFTVKYVMEILFLIFYLFYIYKFLINIIKYIKAYQKWEIETMELLSEKTLSFRKRVLPEIYRIITSILSYSRLSEIALMILAGFVIYYRIRIIDFQSNFSFEELEEIKDDKHIFFLREKMYENIDYYNYYMFCITIMLVIMSILIIKVMAFGKYFSILIKTLKDSSRNNIIFIGVLLICQPAFIFFSNIAFGYNLSQFSNLSDSLWQCVNLLFGILNFYSYYNTDEVLGPIFFFLYIIIFHMILLNIFVGIIDQSYRKVRTSLILLKERYDLKKVFLFCCYRKSSVVSLQFDNADSHYDYFKILEKVDIAFPPQIIKDLYLKPHEWATHEMQYICKINQAMDQSQNEEKKLKMAILSKELEMESLFDDSSYKGVDEKHMTVSKYVQSIFFINTKKKLLNDLFDIERHSIHLDQYIKENQSTFKLNSLKEKNNQNYKEIQELEKVFLELYSDINELGEVAKKLEKVDIQMAELKKNQIIAKDIFDNFQKFKINSE
jgi:hypothetical protein